MERSDTIWSNTNRFFQVQLHKLKKKKDTSKSKEEAWSLDHLMTVIWCFKSFLQAMGVIDKNKKCIYIEGRTIHRMRKTEYQKMEAKFHEKREWYCIDSLVVMSIGITMQGHCAYKITRFVLSHIWLFMNMSNIKNRAKWSEDVRPCDDHLATTLEITCHQTS